MAPLLTDRGVIDIPACPDVPLLPASQHLGAHYRTHLLNTEGPAPALRGSLRELLVDAGDEPGSVRGVPLPGIFESLGGSETAIIEIGQFWILLAIAPRTTRYAAYVRERSGSVCGVHACWMRGAGWGEGHLIVESGPFGRPYRWGAGCTFVTK